MAGRTLLQHAVPVTFGLKAAGWLHALDRLKEPLAALLGGLPVQFGGAAGSLAALEGRGLEVMQLLAAELGLRCPALPWHTLRLPILEAAGVLGRIAAVTSKIARDLSLLSQSEVGEVRESGAAGHGGSSTMPHKHNPIGSIAALSCCRRVPGLVATLLAAAEQEHERAAGGWHAEWETLTELVRLVGSALSWLRAVLEGLEVDAARMRQNLDAALGLPLAERLSSALAPALGRNAAQAFVTDACARAERSGRPLLGVLTEDPQRMRVLGDAGIDTERLTALLDPAAYLGNARELIERALAEHAQLKPANP
jgi:3-carboxy-cis,cis-muconate cycloisomerase